MSLVWMAIRQIFGRIEIEKNRQKKRINLWIADSCFFWGMQIFRMRILAIFLKVFI